jgi:hypothetical protein
MWRMLVISPLPSKTIGGHPHVRVRRSLRGSKKRRDEAADGDEASGEVDHGQESPRPCAERMQQKRGSAAEAAEDAIAGQHLSLRW